MWGSRLSHIMNIPNTKRHPNNTKTDQLPIFWVITGLPRPYHNTYPGLGNRSIFYPGSSVGNTVTFGVDGWPTMPFVRWQGGDTEYLLADLPIKVVLGATHFLEPQMT